MNFHVKSTFVIKISGWDTLFLKNTAVQANSLAYKILFLKNTAVQANSLAYKIFNLYKSDVFSKTQWLSSISWNETQDTLCESTINLHHSPCIRNNLIFPCVNVYLYSLHIYSTRLSTRVLYILLPYTRLTSIRLGIKTKPEEMEYRNTSSAQTYIPCVQHNLKLDFRCPCCNARYCE